MNFKKLTTTTIASVILSISVIWADPGIIHFYDRVRQLSEGTPFVEIMVKRSNGSEGLVTIDYTTVDGTAFVDMDYIATAGTLEWTDGDDSVQSFNIPLVDDMEHEGREEFYVDLSNPTGGASVEPGHGIVRIDDDDPIRRGNIAFNDAEYIVNEGQLQVTVRLIRTGGNDGPALVDVASFDGTAIAGDDYIPFTKLIIWEDKEDGIKSFDVQLINDDTPEFEEQFSLSLDIRPFGPNPMEPTTATIIITDEDIYPSGKLQFEFSNYIVEESDPSLEVKVLRLDGNEGPISVEYFTTDGSATAGSDFLSTKGFLEWDHGDSSSKSFLVQILDDPNYELTENFLISIHNPSGGASLGIFSTTQVDITDNEAPTRGDVSFGITTPEFYMPREADTELVIPIVRNGGTLQFISVEYRTISINATDGTDFEDQGGTLRYSDGEEVEYIRIPLFEDDIPEDPESFDVQLYNPINTQIVGALQKTITILSDDIPEMEVGEDRIITAGETIVLAAQATRIDSLTSIWEMVSGPAPIEFFNPNILITNARFNRPGIYIVKISGDVGFGLEEKDSLMINATAPPQSAAPSGATKNIVNLSNGGPIQINCISAGSTGMKISIYDRFGTEAIELPNNGQCPTIWNGRDRDGQQVNPGIYHAIIEENGTRRKVKLAIWN